MSVNATPKQISYALALLHRNGYDTRYMNASFKELGATMWERSGTVEYWLGQMTKPEISDLIDHLKERAERA